LASVLPKGQVTDATGKISSTLERVGWNPKGNRVTSRLAPQFLDERWVKCVYLMLTILAIVCRKPGQKNTNIVSTIIFILIVYNQLVMVIILCFLAIKI
jgi:hypothetical protein